MKKNLLFFALLFFSLQFSFAQKSASTIKQEASEAFENGEYELTVTRVNQLSSVFKQVLPQYLAYRIKALGAIVSGNPYDSYQRLETTRSFISSFLKKFAGKDDPNYNSILEIRDVFDTYPKTETSFIATKKAKEQEAINKKNLELKAAEIKRKKELRDLVIRDSMAVIYAANARIKYSSDSIQAVKQAEIDRVKRQNSAIQAEKGRKAQEIVDKKNARIHNFRYNTFSNLGVIIGDVAKYGILFEHGGGNNFLGYHIALRTSAVAKQDILSGKVVKHRTEFDVGPNIKLSNYLYLNLGAGYGYYNYPNRNDYSSQPPSMEMQTYLVTSGGLMIRLGRLINLSSGVSFMDIDKGFYKPEIVAGLTFNLKSK
ncbi:MAG: hypothetical protein EOO93_27140 [Pedobacter sp.]|nr:MAG: hypothetical protein EOO93_27140 [Pedobacter sp.]